jgi:hypothetical protein
MKIHEIPAKVTVVWDPELKVIFDVWSDFRVTTEEFKTAVLTKGLAFAKENGGWAYVVDASKAKGVFNPEIQKIIETQVFKNFAAAGVKRFLTIPSASAETNASIAVFTAHASPAGVQGAQFPNRAAAIAWLRDNR